MSIRTDKEEKRNKILMVLESAGKPQTGKELAQHPTLSGMSAQSVGAILRFLSRDGKITRLKSGKYKPHKSGAKPTTDAPTAMYFVITIENQSIQLDIGGLRLPVRVE